jgi:gamma-glutamylcyclotransferase (GGCT)/AIG2-like uncharacterized protein YtfP
MTNLCFAYGSNLNNDDWTGWCRRNGHPGNLLEPLFPAWLPDRQLRFTVRSKGRAGGILDVVPRNGHLVPGYVFRVGPEGLAALDEKEGAPNLYRRIDAVCLKEGGEECPVVTYEVRPERRKAFVEPAASYVQVVAAGLQAFDLDEGPLQAAERNDNGSTLTPGLFVYGTLMRGECRRHLMTAGSPTCTLLSELPGTLHDLGSYPGLRLPNGEEPATLVEGEFLRLAKIDQILEELDRVEGFNGFGAQGSQYRRTLVDVGVGDGRVRHAWTNVYAGDITTAPVIPSGDWRIHRGRKQECLRAIAEAHCGGHPESELARIIVSKNPWITGDGDHETEGYLPIWRAMQNGRLSERELAQASGVWNAWSAWPAC